MLVFISDGKPSDKLPLHQVRRLNAVTRLAQKLKLRLNFLGMGIGASGSDFEQLRLLVETAEDNGAEGQFTHAGLNPTSLSTTLSSVAMAMTTTRNDLLSKNDRVKKTEKSYTMRKKKSENDGLVPFRRECKSVSRWLYDRRNTYPWREVEFINQHSCGFDIEEDPFGKVCRLI